MDNDRLDVDRARLQKAGAELININLQTNTFTTSQKN